MDSPTPKPRKKTPQNAGKVAAKAIAEAKASAESAPQKKKTGRLQRETQFYRYQFYDLVPLL
jgi:hypothetical protein